METKYIVEYKYEDDTEWKHEDEYYLPSDAHRRLVEHVKTFSYIHVRVRQVKYIEQESIVGEYQPVEVPEDA